MAKRFEFRVCQVQASRVTYVNGKWQGNLEKWHGKTAPMVDRPEASLAGCSEEWEYLRTAGEDGWDLVTVVGELTARMLYLRRERE